MTKTARQWSIDQVARDTLLNAAITITHCLRNELHQIEEEDTER